MRLSPVTLRHVATHIGYYMPVYDRRDGTVMVQWRYGTCNGRTLSPSHACQIKSITQTSEDNLFNHPEIGQIYLQNTQFSEPFHSTPAGAQIYPFTYMSYGHSSTNSKIPFGTSGRQWDGYDDYAYISNQEIQNNSLFIDVNTYEIEENTVEDLSGNLNKGDLISDYKIDFDDETRYPEKTKSVNKIRVGRKNNKKAY